MAYKLVVLVRQDLKLPKGKLAVQAAHAAVECVMKTDRRVVDSWRREGGKKVVLKVSDEKELLSFRESADGRGLKSALIADAGKTTVEPGTITCLGIGPDDEKRIDLITGNLKVA